MKTVDKRSAAIIHNDKVIVDAILPRLVSIGKLLAQTSLSREELKKLLEEYIVPGILNLRHENEKPGVIIGRGKP